MSRLSEPTAGVTRVMLIDDDVLLREGLSSLIGAAGFEVVAQASDASQLDQLIRQAKPDLLVIDIRMPPTHTIEGIEAAKRIRSTLPSLAILVLSSHVEVDHAIDLLNSGPGIGYLLKQRISKLDDFLSSLRRVSAGESVIDPALVSELLLAQRSTNPLDRLTPRECEVLSLMAEGRSNLGIGQELHMTEGTVEKHVHRIFDKLGLGAETNINHRRVLAVIKYLDMV
ncbi:response regulator [Lacisediminihabitans changchengi]|uniref:Response regulator transcription factor n=1 Tax=Lacisediminihabitans changchengi TaxID=2787634 RepID=A0A934SNI0_9MICO|nr:response regulator transcription factor [Lacisediminihabitans changchengi]MBK4348793.1 response regulator transcription factor [Lacisediminihabitans changchengi]